jgi:hypothetical protein
LFETLLCYSVGVLTARIADSAVEAFKTRTRDKLRGVWCPVHRQAPRLKFQGETMREIQVSMSACCEQLARIANKAIGSA